MATLTQNKARSFTADGPGAYIIRTVKAASHLYQGEGVSDDGDGDLRTLTAVDDNFEGFATEEVDNSGGADGAKKITVLQKGVLHGVSVTGVTGVGDIGDSVYMSDGDTFTKTSTNNSLIGKIINWVSGTTVDVEFCAESRRSL